MPSSHPQSQGNQAQPNHQTHGQRLYQSKINLAFGILLLIGSASVFFVLVGRHTYANAHFDSYDNWEISNLTYNGTSVAHLGKGWTMSSLAISSQSFVLLAFSLVPVGIYLMVKGKPFPQMLYLSLGVIFITVGLVSLWAIFYGPSPTYPLQELEEPWSLSSDGDLWLDWHRGFKGRRTGGHHLMVRCPDNSIESTQEWGRIYRIFVTGDPVTIPKWPLCEDYFQTASSKLYRMCCGKRAVLQPSDPQPVFDKTKTIFAGTFLSFLGCVLTVGLGLTIHLWWLKRPQSLESRPLGLTSSSYQVNAQPLGVE